MSEDVVRPGGSRIAWIRGVDQARRPARLQNHAANTSAPWSGRLFNPDNRIQRPSSALFSSPGLNDAIEFPILYQQNMTFIDPNKAGYQVYPGFELPVPIFA